MSFTFDKRKNLKNNKKNNSLPVSPAHHSQLPNSLVQRILEDQDAESEANRLSSGLTSTTPDEVMREMGSRLGADFSNVQFHSDSLSMKRSQAMGARAWAQGRDVYFGKGGFSPSVAAHELVHTVQQGAVQGNVSHSVPSNTVQLIRNPDEDQENKRQVPNNVSNLELMMQQYNSGNLGRSLFDDLAKPIKKQAEKSGNRAQRKPTAQNSIQYLSFLGERDYAGKQILKDIAADKLDNKDDMYEREDEYEGFMDFIEKRTDKPHLEAAGYEIGIFTGQPRHQLPQNNQSNKRAYEFSAEEIRNGQYNPQNDASVQNGLEAIDRAATAKDAYLAFIEYTGIQLTPRQRQDNSFYINFARNMNHEIVDVNVAPLKVKLKNMVRQVRDYPELRKKIGAMTIRWNEKDDIGNDTWGAPMTTVPSPGMSEKAGIYYDAYMDRKGNEQVLQYINKHLSIGSVESIGNHELGHVLGSSLDEDHDQLKKHTAENSILKTVMAKLRPGEQLPLIQNDGTNSEGEKIYKGEVNTEDAMFEGLTSIRGQAKPGELFAESFHDVYTKGADAKPLSIEVVKEYEKRQIQKQRGNFRKKDRNAFTRFSRWISSFFNFNNRPNQANQPAQPNPIQQPVLPPAAQNPVQNVLNNNVADELNKSMIVHRPKRKKKKKK